MSEAEPSALAVTPTVAPIEASTISISTRSEVLAMFETFRQILDEHTDRYERLVKLSRDLTIQSKRIIFHLHRVALGQTPPAVSAGVEPAHERPTDDRLKAEPGILDPARTAELNAAAQARQKFDELKPLFQKIAAELEGQEAERYSRAISPGLQEFLEALSFTNYLEHGTLITYNQVLKFLDPIPLSVEDYLLGLSDLSGELMRYAVSAASMASGRTRKVAEVCHFVRGCSANWEPLTPYIRGLAKKQQVTNESLKKIEKAAYAIAIRRIEYPDVELQNLLLEFMQDDGGGDGDRATRKQGRNADRGDDYDDDMRDF